MLVQTQLFTNAERLPIDRALIDRVALRVGDQYEEDLFSGYFADYAGMAKKYRPKRIFEIGTRYGYIALCMVQGVRTNRGRPLTEYLGIDDESYHGGSCGRANQNFLELFPDVKMEARKWNSFDGLPPDIGTFDFVHVDGNHDYHGVWNDLTITWPILNPGGFILLDDATEGGSIWAAIQNFLNQFNQGPERVEWQYQENQRNHIYIRKAAE